MARGPISKNKHLGFRVRDKTETQKVKLTVLYPEEGFENRFCTRLRTELFDQSMEKRRSPRSSKSPGTPIFPKSPLVYESYKSGCGWKLINFFDFRHVKSGNKKLSSDKKPIRDSAGNVYTKSQLDLLKRLHERCQCHDRIVEGESPCKSKTRRRSLSSEREDESYEPKPVQGLLEREIKRIKNLREATSESPDKQKQSSSSEIVNTNDKDLKNGRDCRKSSEINLQVCVDEAAETLICSKAEEKGKDRSKQFMEALDILSSNKELFITLLQDPNSFSTKKGQDLERPKVKDLDEIVLLKPRISSSVDDRKYLRFKHLAKKLKLVVGSNKENTQAEIKAKETEAGGDVSTSAVGYRSPESPVFRRKKRVESDVFKLSMENDVLPRRFMVERQQERSDSSPVYEVPKALSSLQTKLKERRQRLEKRRESFKLWSLDKDLEVFDPNPHNSSLRSLNDNSTGSAECTCLRTPVEDLESSSAESSSRLERQEQEHEQEQPSPVSVLERIHMLDETVSSRNKEQIGLLSFDLLEKDSVHEFVKQSLEIFIQSIRDAGLCDSICQDFAVFLPVKSVRVQGDILMLLLFAQLQAKTERLQIGNLLSFFILMHLSTCYYVDVNT
ncbi:hypothetical protein HID58_085489 [Brassica napus]|uniref:DUF3741 domain-containing protein n=2 Tax=Brassica napus TaxID=3708 RepID=A0ABQ7XMQ7_BRANA|nr:hypothetical protein HID58_085489 [Brassica napus]CDY25516.1 BnaC09g11410D [Brassica napus]